MTPLYDIGIRLYGTAIALASIGHTKARKIIKGRRQTERYLRSHVASKRGPWVWIHAASLGEFEQGRPLIERIKAEQPETKILLTFFSPSGYEVRRDYRLADAVCYLPLDTRAHAARFLDIVKPSKAIFVKYEFWGNFLGELHRRGIPTYIISAIFRPTQIFFRRYGSAMRHILSCFTRLYVQDEASRKLLGGIGIDNVTVAGDTRFDRVTSIMRSAVDLPLIDRFNSNADITLIAGSSWPADEDILIDWLARHKEVKAIFAPHEFDRARLHALEARLSALGDTRCLSEINEAGRDPATLHYIIVDSFGLLAALYRKGTIAYIGGGLGAGIHNLNEAAAYGIPVVFGPRHEKFKEAADLIKAGGGFDFDDAAAFDTVMTRLVADKELRRRAGAAAGKYIADSIGATDRIFNDIFQPSSK